MHLFYYFQVKTSLKIPSDSLSNANKLEELWWRIATGNVCKYVRRTYHKLKTDKDRKKKERKKKFGALEPHRRSRLTAVWTRSGGWARERKEEREMTEMRDILLEKKEWNDSREKKRKNISVQGVMNQGPRCHKQWLNDTQKNYYICNSLFHLIQNVLIEK